MELGSYFLFLQEQIKDIIIKSCSRMGGPPRVAQQHQRFGNSHAMKGLVEILPRHEPLSHFCSVF
jgi:hypothetical protein